MALTFGMGGNVWPLISWKLSLFINVYQHSILLLGAFHRYLSTVLCGLRQRLCLVDIEFRCHGQDTSVWTDSARGTPGLDSKKISSSEEITRSRMYLICIAMIHGMKMHVIYLSYARAWHM